MKKWTMMQTVFGLAVGGAAVALLAVGPMGAAGQMGGEESSGGAKYAQPAYRSVSFELDSDDPVEILAGDGVIYKIFRGHPGQIQLSDAQAVLFDTRSLGNILPGDGTGPYNIIFEGGLTAKRVGDYGNVDVVTILYRRR